MSVGKALFWRGCFYMQNHKCRQALYIILCVLPVCLLTGFLGVDLEKLKNVDLEHGIVSSEVKSKDDFLLLLATEAKVMVSPSSDDTKQLISLMRKRHSGLSVDYVDESDMSKTTDKEVVMIIFKEISRQKLDYKFVVRLDSSGLFPRVENPGPQPPSHDKLPDNILPIQIAVDEAYMKMYDIPNDKRWSIASNPYPKYSAIPPNVGYSGGPYFLWIILAFVSSMGLLSLYGSQIVEEKASGIGEIFAVYGVSAIQSQNSWDCLFVLHFLVVSVLLTASMKIAFYYVVLLNTSVFLVPIVLMIYFLTCLKLITFFTALCNSPTMWPRFMSACWAAATAPIILRIGSQSPSLIRFFCLLPTLGLYECISAIIEFEKLNQGLQFTNLFSQPPVTYSLLSVGESMLFMILGSIIFSLLGAYFTLIGPRKFGVRKPWYFLCPFLSEYLKSDCFKRENRIEHAPSKQSVREETDNNIPVVIEVREIHKSFGHVKALKGVSLDIRANQITALLGENGAGKTTLMSIMTGMLSQTSGQILVNKQDVFQGNKLSRFRRDIGYCPQDDLLMDYMTVQQHLIFYLLLHGNSFSTAINESQRWLYEFNLLDKKNVAVAKLSGGMKRKLTLCICLVRDPKIIFLDEPTSGLDPVARREVWNILSHQRRTRTTILTTHRMDEADALSDYIAILSHGSLRVFGSNDFLKSRYGSGYQVSFVPLIANLGMLSVLDNILKKFESVSVINSSDKNLVMNVKSDDASKLLRFVETTYGSDVAVSVTSGTVDDAFVQVQREDGVRTSVDETAMPPRNDPKLLRNRECFLMSQYKHLLIKRYFWTRHHWGALLGYILMWPIIAALWAMILPTAGISHGYSTHEASVELRSYGGTMSLISENEYTNEINDITKSLISDQGGSYKILEGSDDIEEALIKEAEKNLKLYRSKLIFSIDLTDSGMTAYYSTVATSAQLIAVNMISNILIRSHDEGNTVHTRLLVYPSFESAAAAEVLPSILPLIVPIIFCSVLMPTFSYFVLFPHTERTSLIKHLQLMTGVHSAVYWTANLVFDVVLMLFALTVIMIVFFIWDTSLSAPFFTATPYLGVTLLIFVLFGLSSIALAYFFSFFFNDKTNCMQAYILSLFIAILLYYLLILIFTFMGRTTSLVAKTFKYVFYLFPGMAFIICLQTAFPSYMTLYMGLDARSEFDDDELFSDLITDISLGLIYLSVDFLLYLIVVIIIDSGLWKKIGILMKIKSVLTCSSGAYYGTSKVDAEVLREKNRIEHLNGENDPLFVVDGLTKSFRRFTASNGVSFTVERGECFGLLGLNGAGKTTTFRMLTGLVDRSSGDARIEGLSLAKNRRSYLKCVGFCPQSGGLLSALSGAQLLRLFGGLRGLRGEELNSAVEKWTEALDIDKIRDRRCGVYSGGNQRKLTVALSLIGDPPVVIMDEPTTGVDPVARRKLWNLLQKYQNSGTCFVLSSHSTDESEALCTRVTVMADGYMKCIGPIGLLKHIYAAGFIMIVRMNNNSTIDDRNKLIEVVEASFPSKNTLTDEQAFLLSFEINESDMKWSKRFSEVDKIKVQAPQVNSISISDSSLERVFYSVINPH